MSLDKIIAYIVLHSELLIEVSIALVAVTSLYLAARAFLRNDSAEEGHASSSSDLSQIEATLKKIVEQGGISKGSDVDYAAAGLTPEQVAQATELKHEVEKLKAELTHRTTQLEELKAKEAAGGDQASGPSEDLTKLEARIKELESKLSEYEIISEDIADLSFYKEENQKLQKELEALKNAAPVAPVAAAPAPVAQPEAEIVGRSKVEVAAEPEPVVPAPAAEESPSFVDDDIMAEFAKAVEQQVATKPTPRVPVAKAPVEEATPAPEPAVIPEAAVEAAPESAPEVAVEAAAEVPVEAEDTSGLGEMNLDKIVEEAQIIEANPITNVDSNVLEESLNEDKLLAEADQFNVSAEDTQAMGQFEEFVKKS